MPSSNRETRATGEFRVEKRADGEGRKIVGYAAVFNQETNIAGFFREMIKPGAFAEAITRDDVHALSNHDYDHVLGRLKAGTLKMLEDDRGLKVEVDPPDTQDARDLMTSMERGDIDQMSFAFSMRGGKEEWDDTGDLPLRTIIKVGELLDVSVVPRGAYPTTEVGLRSLEADREDKRKKEAEAAEAEKARKRENFAAQVTRLKLAKKLDLRRRTTRGA